MDDPVLVLRPEPGAARTAEALEALGFRAIVYPLQRVEPLDWTPPEIAEGDALLVTSANALRHGGPGLSRFLPVPVYAVGEATAALARDMGFKAVHVGGGDVASTVPMIAQGGWRRVVHLSGTDVRDYDPQGLTILRVPVYRTVPCGDAEGLSHALPRERGAYAFVHSPRAGERLATLVTDVERARIAIMAISPAASHACGRGWRDRVAAGAPTEAAMLTGLQMLV